MARYIARRIIQSIPTIFGITVLTFLILYLAPGDPAGALALDPKMKPETRAKYAEMLGLNQPVHMQYLYWLVGDDWRQFDLDGDGVMESGSRRGILRGDFGFSIAQKRPVLQLFAERLGATLELGVLALLMGLLLGVPVGILAAVSRGSAFDNLTRVFAVLVNSVPIFWIGLMMILVFGSMLGLLPMGGRCPTAIRGCPDLFGRLEFILMPMIVLGAGGLAGYSRFLRASMLDVIGQDYMRTAKAKGLRQRVVWFAHGARNALIPLATFLGPAITGIWGGAFVTETIFSWPGIGQLTLQSLTAQDTPMVMAVTIFSALATVFGFILSDIFYAIIDPRIRFN
jgi:peptide/nickel transport system permease protein